MSEISTEFTRVEQSKSANLIAEASILFAFLEEKDNETVVSTELGDATAAFYVAGYISRRISKSLKCSSCKEMCMQDGAIELLFHDNDSDITKEKPKVKDKFLELMDCGGLVKPSDIVYVSCLHIVSFLIVSWKAARAETFCLRVKSQKGVLQCYYGSHG